MIRLTDEEILELDEMCFECGQHDDSEVAKAQLKKVVEWGDEPCIEHEHGKRVDAVPRKHCSECWQALLEEVK